MPTENSYFGVLNRIADALEAQAGFRECLAGQVFDFSTDDGVRAATAALCRALGAEVVNG